MQIKNLMSEDLITVDKDQNLSDALNCYVNTMYPVYQ